MFQAVIDPEQRGSLGQHYTSVPNIMKVIEPLFLNNLREELEKSRKSSNRLKKLLLRLQRIRVFDPACGSGNFLIIAYKELRLIEIDIFKALNELQPQGVMFDSGIALSQFYGIEIDDFAHEIALLSLWLSENQMNTVFEKKFGYREPMLPLKPSGNIISGNSLQKEWSSICPQRDANGELEVYICGNPPFVHSKKRTEEQNNDMESIFIGYEKYGFIDYVASWFVKASIYLQGNDCQAGFVSTNSITQGEQVSQLWPNLLKHVEIDFAVKSFPWSNNAKQSAGVHVVIIGLKGRGRLKNLQKQLYFEQEGTLVSNKVVNISPYLFEGSDSAICSRAKPFPGAQEMIYGNYYGKCAPLILSPTEKDHLLNIEPKCAEWIRPFVGANEFLNKKEKWCIWLAGVSPESYSTSIEIQKRLLKTKSDRLASGKKMIRERSSLTPQLFPEIRQPSSGNYLLIPIVSSERREYVPIGYFDSEYIASNKVFMLPNASLFTFGVISSVVHMDWMRLTCGRLESRYSYSNKLVYNTFPYPATDSAQRHNIENLAEEILLIREDYPDKTLAQLYNPETIPSALLEAHKNLDRAVEKLYRDKPFENAAERLDVLFKRYEQLIAEEAEGAKNA